MTPLPKRKISRARQGKRRNSIKKNLILTTSCPECNKPKLPHRACSYCGKYNQREIIKIKTKKKSSKNSK